MAKSILHTAKFLIQFLLYLIIQIAFIPFIVLGLLHGLYKEMIVSKKMKVSFSAGQTLQYRWYMHYFGTRTDQLTIEFVKKFPCESHFGLLSTVGALVISNRLFGFKTKLNKLPESGHETIDSTAGARVVAFDKIMEKYIDEVDQVVLPGAGFDLIALKYTKNREVEVFELDQESTMKVKVDTLKKAGIEHEWVRYIPVDYANESWKDKLIEAGFDKSKRTLFLWQSVSLFLDETIVREALKDMAELCNQDSIIAQDFYSKSFVSGEMSKIAKRTGNLMGRMGEPWIFGLDMSPNPKTDVGVFLESCGLKMTECNQFGEYIDIEPYYFVVEARKR